MLGVIVEGPSDEKVIREITNKLGITAEIRMSRRGAKIQSPKKTKSFVDLLHDCDKIVILKDSHCSDPEEIESNLGKRLRELGLAFDGNIRICIVVHAVESRLLADEDAIGDYLGSKVKEVHNPENACKPEEILDGIFKKNGREYLKGGEAPREIAKRLRLEKVIKKCPSFIKFKAFIG
jgi:5S rRNA maturation endonuclease (ribonuclease M5)